MADALIKVLFQIKPKICIGMELYVAGELGVQMIAVYGFTSDLGMYGVLGAQILHLRNMVIWGRADKLDQALFQGGDITGGK